MNDLAREVLKFRVSKTRDNGVRFQALKDDAPEWMSELCMDAHGRMLPDDLKFKFIFEALDALASSDEDEARDSLEADHYNADLLNWVSSSLSRIEYVNEAAQNYGVNSNSFDLCEILRMGQLTEKLEVFESVVNSLQEKLDE